MLNVSNKTKELFKSDSIHKEMEVRIYAYGGPYVFNNSLIYSESFELTETLLDGSDMSFVGCIPSEMKITVRNVNNLRENAFDKSKITVSITPYEDVPTKNKLRPIYGAGETFTKNGLSCTINSDLSIHIDGRATEDTYIPYSEFIGMSEDVMWLSGCPSLIGSENINGVLTVLKENGTTNTYVDDGNEIVVGWDVGDTCNYSIFIAEGTGITDTFYPMLRGMQESSEYEPYGTLPVAADTVPLFYGYVDSGKYDNDKSWLKITAYDVFYNLQSLNIWNWYRSEFSGGAKSFSTILTDFITYINNSGLDIGIDANRCPVILSAVKIKKRLSNKDMTALDFLKSFCQLSCACGIIGRDGNLHLVYLNPNSASDSITYYRSATSKDYLVRPFEDGITIRQSSKDNGVTLTSPTSITVDWDDDTQDTYVADDDDIPVDIGRYFIEGNGLVKKLSKNKRTAIINILLNNVQTNYYTFKSYEVVCNGLPYMECGDIIEYLNGTSTVWSLPVMNRRLSGIQAMVDTISFDVTTSDEYGKEVKKKLTL